MGKGAVPYLLTQGRPSHVLGTQHWQCWRVTQPTHSCTCQHTPAHTRTHLHMSKYNSMCLHTPSRARDARARFQHPIGQGEHSSEGPHTFLQGAFASWGPQGWAPGGGLDSRAAGPPSTIHRCSRAWGPSPKPSCYPPLLPTPAPVCSPAGLDFSCCHFSALPGHTLSIRKRKRIS